MPRCVVSAVAFVLAACPQVVPDTRTVAPIVDAGSPAEAKVESPTKTPSKAEPTKPDAAAALARAKEALLMGLDPQQAVADARAAVQGTPENAEAHRILGQALEETGDTTGSRQAYADAARLGDPWARRRLASIASAEGSTDEAIAQWESLRDSDASDPATHLELAALYEKADRPASAEAALRTALEAAPGNVAVIRRLAGFLERQGKVAEAKRLRSGLDANDDAPRRLRELPKSRR